MKSSNKGDDVMKNSKEQIEKIVSKYVAKERTPLDDLKELDNLVRKPVTIFGYVFGTIASLIMGLGMSFILTDLGSSMGKSKLILGIAIGVIGLVMAIVNYPICDKLLSIRKAKYSADICKIYDKIEMQDSIEM